MNKHTSWVWRALSLALVAIIAFSPVSAASLHAQQPPGAESLSASGAQAPVLDSQAVPEEDVLAKLYPSLLELARNYGTARRR
jgi:hypothetical protein